jgi:hypothetical protein
METSTLIGGLGLTLSLCGIIYTAINHRRIRLKLCNRRYDFSIDVDTTDTSTPNEDQRKKEEKLVDLKQDSIEKNNTDIKVYPVKTNIE